MHRFILHKIGQLNQTHRLTYVLTLLGTLMKRCASLLSDTIGSSGLARKSVKAV